MREILFRGKRLDNNEWVYGSLIVYSVTKDGKTKKYDIKLQDAYNTNLDNYRVIPETISQFTGLTDKNEVKIFEGDKFDGDESGEYYVISWNEEEATFQANLYGYNVSYGEGSQEIYDDEVTCIDTNCFELSALSSDIIIGNIHDTNV